MLESGIDLEVNSGGELYQGVADWRSGLTKLFSTAPARVTANWMTLSRAGIYAINVDSIYEIGLVEEAVKRVAAASGESP